MAAVVSPSLPHIWLSSIAVCVAMGEEECAGLSVSPVFSVVIKIHAYVLVVPDVEGEDVSSHY